MEKGREMMAEAEQTAPKLSLFWVTYNSAGLGVRRQNGKAFGQEGHYIHLP